MQRSRSERWRSRQVCAGAPSRRCLRRWMVRIRGKSHADGRTALIHFAVRNLACSPRISALQRRGHNARLVAECGSTRRAGAFSGPGCLTPTRIRRWKPAVRIRYHRDCLYCAGPTQRLVWEPASPPLSWIKGRPSGSRYRNSVAIPEFASGPEAQRRERVVASNW